MMRKSETNWINLNPEWRHFLRWLVPLLWALVVSQCAHKAAPPGGPVDRIAPEVVDHYPQSNLTHVSLTQEIGITFSEAMDKSSVVDALFVSPAPKQPPKMKWRGRTLKISLAEKFQTDRTYVITLGVGCRDLRNNNLAKSLSFAFSTGEKIDMGSIDGRVYDGISPRKGVGLWAYRLSGDVQPDPAIDAPDYITQTDGHGHFRFDHLGRGQYRVFAVEDLDANRKFELETELMAVPSGDVLLSEAELSTSAWPFRLAYLDTTGPSLQAADAPEQGKVVLSFDEPLDSVIAASKPCYRLYEADGESVPLQVSAVSFKIGSKDRVILSTGPQEEGRRYLIALSELRDLAGNQINPPGDQGEFFGSSRKDIKGPALVQLWPPDSAEGIPRDAFVSLCFDEAVEPVSVESSFVLSDSSRRSLAGKIQWSHSARLTFFPDQPLGGGEWHSISLNAPEVSDLAGNPMGEALLETSFQTVDAEQLGSLSGKINRPAIPEGGTVFIRAHWLKQLGHESLMTTQEEKYRFLELLPGRYVISAFLDLDGNGRFSYGQPIPFIPAEPYWISQDTVMVRSRWETGGVDITLGR